MMISMDGKFEVKDSPLQTPTRNFSDCIIKQANLKKKGSFLIIIFIIIFLYCINNKINTVIIVLS